MNVFEACRLPTISCDTKCGDRHIAFSFNQQCADQESHIVDEESGAKRMVTRGLREDEAEFIEAEPTEAEPTDNKCSKSSHVTVEPHASCLERGETASTESSLPESLQGDCNEQMQAVVLEKSSPRVRLKAEISNGAEQSRQREATGDGTEQGPTMFNEPQGHTVLRVETLEDLVGSLRLYKSEGDVKLELIQHIDSEGRCMREAMAGDILYIMKGLVGTGRSKYEAVAAVGDAICSGHESPLPLQDPVAHFYMYSELIENRLWNAQPCSKVRPGDVESAEKHRTRKLNTWGCWEIPRQCSGVPADSVCNCTAVYIGCYLVIVALENLEAGARVRLDQKTSRSGVPSQIVGCDLIRPLGTPCARMPGTREQEPLPPPDAWKSAANPENRTALSPCALRLPLAYSSVQSSDATISA